MIQQDIFEKAKGSNLKSLFVLLAFSFFSLPLLAQVPLQTIRGIVSDLDSKQALTGASISILERDGSTGTSSDEYGKFTRKPPPWLLRSSGKSDWLRIGNLISIIVGIWKRDGFHLVDRIL